MFWCLRLSSCMVLGGDWTFLPIHRRSLLWFKSFLRSTKSSKWLRRCEFCCSFGHSRLQNWHILPERMFHDSFRFSLVKFLVTSIINFLVFRYGLSWIFTPLDPGLPRLSKRYIFFGLVVMFSIINRCISYKFEELKFKTLLTFIDKQLLLAR